MFGTNSETEVESKIGVLKTNSEQVFNFIKSFNNFENLIPKDKIQNWQSSDDHCSFKISGVGDFGMKIIERKPYSLIKISNLETVPFDFFLWVQLKEISENDIRIKLTIKAQLNPMLKMAAQKPLKQMVDSIVNQLEVKFNT